MTSILYLVAILLVGGSAVFSFLNASKHKQYTQDTFDNRKVNDQLEKDIAFSRGSHYKLDEIMDKGDLAKTPEAAFKLIISRKIAGWENATDLTRVADRTDKRYEREEDGKLLKFEQYNAAIAKRDASEDGKNTAELDSVHTKAKDIIVGKAKINSTRDISDAIGAKLDSLAKQVSDLTANISQVEGKRDGLEEEIKKFVEAEAEVKKEFASEGVTDLKGGNELLATLEQRQKDRLSEQKVLQGEEEALTEKRDSNNDKLASQAEYKSKRKVSLGANSKTFRLSSVDFNWGFVVIKTDESTKFFINQKLMIIRGRNTHVGDVIITAVEPGRVMANIDYKSIASGNSIKRSDVAILADPADQ